MRLSATILGFVAAASLTLSPAVFAKPNGAGPANKPTTSGKPTKTTSGKPMKATSDKPTAHGKPTKSTSGAATTTTQEPRNPIAAKIASKPNLSSKISGMLPIDPATGKTMTLDKASLGFKNQGQFIAALHVSQNLGIPFAELKSHMVTVTPGVNGAPGTATQTGSLGQAIQASKSTASTSSEVEKAEKQAAADLSGSTVPKSNNKKKTTTTTSGAQ